jgi:hypothetical protein
MKTITINLDDARQSTVPDMTLITPTAHHSNQWAIMSLIRFANWLPLGGAT